MIIQNGIVQRQQSEVPIDWISSNQWIEGPDGFWYYNNPFNQTPWTSFYGKIEHVGPPKAFTDIFGPQPTSVDELTFWTQQLGLFKVAMLPTGVSAAQQQNLEDLFKFYGVGKPVSWETVRGDFIITPVGVKELFNTQDFGPDIYNRPEQGIAVLQVALLNKGVRPTNLVQMLTNVKIEHQG